MTRSSIGFVAAAGIALAVFALAFVIAPRACEGGLEVYFWSGVGALVVLVALPFASRIGGSGLVRAAWALGFLVLGTGVWFAGLFAANVRIMCRLF